MRRQLYVFVFAACLTLPVYADSGNPLPADEDQWRFTLAFPMIWAPDINGKVRGGQDIDFTIPFGDIIENLDMGIMGEFYANRGPFGLAVRVNYMNVRNEKTRSGTVLDTTVRTDLKMGIADLLASWKVHEKVRLLTGVRSVLADLELEVETSLGGSVIGSEKIPVTDEVKYDLLIGINLDHWFTEKWGIMFNSDVGVVGDNDRDFSAEFRALLRLGSLNNFWFGYRFLNIGSDSTIDGVEYKVDMTQHGPMVGWAFTF